MTGPLGLEARTEALWGSQGIERVFDWWSNVCSVIERLFDVARGWSFSTLRKPERLFDLGPRTPPPTHAAAAHARTPRIHHTYTRRCERVPIKRL